MDFGDILIKILVLSVSFISVLSAAVVVRDTYKKEFEFLDKRVKKDTEYQQHPIAPETWEHAKKKAVILTNLAFGIGIPLSFIATVLYHKVEYSTLLWFAENFIIYLMYGGLIVKFIKAPSFLQAGLRWYLAEVVAQNMRDKAQKEAAGENPETVIDVADDDLDDII